MLFFMHIPFVVNLTFNAKPTEMLQQLNFGHNLPATNAGWPIKGLNMQILVWFIKKKIYIYARYVWKVTRLCT